ncbi:MAG: MINDY family deubiquitinase, partial [Planctomycetota bacterium]
MTKVTEAQIMSVLADHVSRSMTQVKDSGDAEQQATRQYAVSDFLDLLPSLNTGLDVNVRFDSPVAFEFTRQLSVFDVFPNVRLVHGWLVDPQDTKLTVALSQISYNQLVDELVRTQHSFSDLPSVATAPPPDAFVPATAPPPEEEEEE